MILIVDMNYKKDSLGIYEFVHSIASIAKGFEKCTVKHYLELGREDLDKCSRMILSGNALMDEQCLNKLKLFSWIRTCEKPVLGICAGMQTICLVFGSSLERCVEIGMKRIETVKENLLFSASFDAYELHSHAVQLSAEFEALARSKKCVQAVKHKQKDVYGVLFHPEVRNKEIIERFVALPSRSRARVPRK
jgi:GMP synthase (glutamine-hydrolysing)